MLTDNYALIGVMLNLIYCGTKANDLKVDIVTPT